MKTLRPDRLLSLLCLLSGFFAGALPASAQDLRAEAEVYTRVHDDVVQVAIEIAIDDDWHLYHKEFADKNAVGMPTTITLDAEGITWSSLQFPEPEIHAQLGMGMDPPPKIEQHHGVITVFAAGKADDAATIEKAAEDLIVSIGGLTCEDGEGGTCIPYNEDDLEVAGNGDPTLWAQFPVMLMSELGVSFTAPMMQPATMAKATPVASTQGGEKKPSSFDERFGNQFGSGFDSNSKADATLYSRVEDGEVKVAIVIEIDDHWHLYHDQLGPPDAVGQKTAGELKAKNVTWDFIHFPKPIKYEQPGLGARDPETKKGRDTWIWGHEGRIVVYAKGRVQGDAGKVSAELNGQTCEDGAGGTCVLWSANPRSKGPGEDTLFANFPESDDRPWVDEYESQLSPGANGGSHSGDPDGAAGTEKEKELSFLAFLLLAVGGGLITLLMPCTYPMIPITISFFTKQADARDGKVLPLSITYGIGIVAIFVLIGIVIGGPILKFAAHPVTNLVIGLMFIAFALSLFGMFNLQPPAFLMNAAGKASMKGGYFGVFLMGATLVITSFTCTAPFVGSLLAAGATGEESNVLRIAAGMGVFGATVAIPFVFLSLLPGKVKDMPQSGQWMNVLKVTLGFVELAAALKFLSNSDLSWGWGVISKEFFLVMWLGIFLAASMFLFGWIDLKGETGGKVGPGRMVAGVCFLLLSLYCGLGVLGAKLDSLMAAFAPPYSSFAAGSRLPGVGGEDAEKPRVIIEDDYETAIALALAEDKQLLLNFTGIT